MIPTPAEVNGPTRLAEPGLALLPKAGRIIESSCLVYPFERLIGEDVLRRRFPTSSLPSGTHELLSADGLTVFRGSWRGVRIFVPDARRPELSDPRPSQIRAAARNHFPGRRTSLAGHLRCRGAQERGRRGALARTGPGTA